MLPRNKVVWQQKSGNEKSRRWSDRDLGSKLMWKRDTLAVGRRLGRRYAAPALVVLGVVLCASPLLACPNCKDAIASGPNSMNLVRGYFWSIVFMMSMPFLILGGLGSYFYFEVRRARRANPAGSLSLPASGATPANWPA